MPSRSSARKLAPERSGRPRRGPAMDTLSALHVFSLHGLCRGGIAMQQRTTAYERSRIGIPLTGRTVRPPRSPRPRSLIQQFAARARRAQAAPHDPDAEISRLGAPTASQWLRRRLNARAWPRTTQVLRSRESDSARATPSRYRNHAKAIVALRGSAAASCVASTPCPSAPTSFEKLSRSFIGTWPEMRLSRLRRCFRTGAPASTWRSTPF